MNLKEFKEMVNSIPNKYNNARVSVDVDARCYYTHFAEATNVEKVNIDKDYVVISINDDNTFIFNEKIEKLMKKVMSSNP